MSTYSILYFVAAMPTGFLREYPITPRTRSTDYPQAIVADATTPQISSLLTTESDSVLVAVEKGHAWMSQISGLGVELDEAVVEK